MRLAVYSRAVGQDEEKTFQSLINFATKLGIELLYHEQLTSFLDNLGHQPEPNSSFHSHKSLQALRPDIFISIGGDGTLLDTLLLVKDLAIPILGINTGRLGFLSHTQPDEIELALNRLLNGEYSIEKRAILETELDGNLRYSLNDVSFHKRDTSAMITIHVSLNGENFNSYWADGLLIATPTGSTAYSLSCGGPILFPDAQSLLITPVAPHNLNVRPVILSDQSELSLKFEGRGENFLVAFDSRNLLADYKSEILVRKARFRLHMIVFQERSFAKSLHEKLNWGKDSRNLLHPDTDN